MKNRVSKKEAFALGLPKWPQFYVTGESVTEEQAVDIICRCDYYLTEFLSSYSGGNDRIWNKYLRDVMGSTPINDLYEKVNRAAIGICSDQTEELETNRFATLGEIWNIQGRISKATKQLPLEYLYTNQISSSFIFGEHGWCWLDGRIFHEDNIGKWPSVSEVYGELHRIAKAFPYLKMTGTLYSGESCEDDTKPIITFVVRDGKVAMTMEHDEYHFAPKATASFEERFNDGNALMDGQIRDYEFGRKIGDVYRPHVEKEIAKLKAKGLL